ncbi:MAG: YbaB/EbfC family nucleoid-associated protein [Verrucomicrobiota bacterium]
MNIKKMMQQAQKMQEQMLHAQEDLAKKTVTATAGGGKITVVANGAGDVISIKIAPEVVDPQDVELLEELVLTGVRKAVEEGKALAQSEMSKLTGGLNLPF